MKELGYNGAESYGVSYKVRGLCDDHSNLDIMDEVSVWGDINGTVLAYNYFGHYSFGHQSGHLDSNEVINFWNYVTSFNAWKPLVCRTPVGSYRQQRGEFLMFLHAPLLVCRRRRRGPFLMAYFGR